MPVTRSWFPQTTPWGPPLPHPPPVPSPPGTPPV
jgi:hypothetical protein